MRRKVSIHGFAESRKEGLFAKAREESEATQLVLDRILHLRLNKLRRLLGKAKEEDRKLILYTLQKMAR